MLDLSAIVLAAGLSRRAAPHNKLLLPFGDSTVVRSTVSAVCDAGFAEVIVVTGFQREKVEAALAGLPVRFVFADEFASGMGHSLAAGVRASSLGTDGLAITPGDLPSLHAGLVARISRHFVDQACAKHVIPTASGRRGHPVVIGKWLREKLCSLEGDAGARILLALEAEKLRTVYLETGDMSILHDVDRGI